ncbi:nitroreductase family protein [Alkaliphilus hydrothermalis]|uniref:Nitroreductase n=1 Tax=Alkaliphilus hydrothermalis TaxID=1482730 RepID=A0ABS2NPX7_9FIRM|nr:nitroreductase family protein [Alkaliphilus hydrothermalis]MBM7614992.1 nitroreductase [Alkaliphilus hydrothermalis]
MRYRWLIENRISVRDFRDIHVDKSKMIQLINYSEGIKGLLEDIKVDFIFVSDGKIKRNLLKGKVGYKGHIVEAPHYIVMTSEEKPQYLQNASYMMEELLLKANELDLGTCWLTVEDEEGLRKDLELTNAGKIVAMAALGYPKGRVPFTPKSTSTRISLYEFVYHEKWGEEPKENELESRGLMNILYHIRMAPSWKNQQPWRLIIDGEKLILVVGGEEIPQKSLLLDSGIMMLYLERIFNEAGIRVRWELYDDDLENIYETYNIPKDYKVVGCLRL